MTDNQTTAERSGGLNDHDLEWSFGNRGYHTFFLRVSDLQIGEILTQGTIGYVEVSLKCISFKKHLVISLVFFREFPRAFPFFSRKVFHSFSGGFTKRLHFVY